jgi:mannitol/fructose-specific phosphotransferase system IIA component (Ntr-type)
MVLHQHLPAEHIVTNLEGETKFQIMEELLEVLHRNKKILNRDLALEDVLARESYLSTGLENGLAIPHAKTDGVQGLVASLGIKREGVEFESLDGQPASIVFLVLSPRDTSGPHIQTLAIIARTLKDRQVREQILNAGSPEDIAAIIKSEFDKA